MASFSETQKGRQGVGDKGGVLPAIEPETNRAEVTKPTAKPISPGLQIREAIITVPSSQ